LFCCAHRFGCGGSGWVPHRSYRGFLVRSVMPPSNSIPRLPPPHLRFHPLTHVGYTLRCHDCAAYFCAARATYDACQLLGRHMPRTPRTHTRTINPATVYSFYIQLDSVLFCRTPTLAYPTVPATPHWHTRAPHWFWTCLVLKQHKFEHSPHARTQHTHTVFPFHAAAHRVDSGID